MAEASVGLYAVLLLSCLLLLPSARGFYLPGVAPRDFHKFKMRRDESCKVVCRTKLSSEAAKNFKEKIDDEYRVNM
ncbi:hypothetical protein BHE74_00032252 [Ensete ventricosum]|nr:hypothetical protein GW17_00027072 [Ensete ventricosum]RWW60733.1 hypothetical protein BHE74_00032252 [Ensete ventricosum]RZR80009.1 hypothetical protein BHM03_00005877 [Ensete ventricosum]